MRPTATMALMLAALVALVGQSSAQIPQKLNYQVMLTDDLDQPLADQSVELVFTIYDAESGGTALWTETQNVMTNSIGVVSVLLGDVTPVDFEITGPIWLEVEVDGEPLSPRRQLVTAPYAAWAARADDAAALGGVESHEYVLADDLDGPGTVNDPSNPVDWNVLFGVPAGFADGTDDTGGAGDGHSLDASDGSPTDALYVDAEGNVGIGTTSPQSEFHVREELQVGSTATLGSLMVHGGSAGNGGVLLQGEGYDGGFVALAHGNGLAYAALMRASGNGGGQVWLGKDTVGSHGFFVDANYLDTGAALMDMFGADAEHRARIDLSSDGNATVQFPDDAISSTEILDEPGVASALDAGAASFTGSVQTIEIRSLTAPADGYIFAIGTAELGLYHTYNTSNNNTTVQVGLTDDYPTSTTGIASSQKLEASIPDEAGSGTYRQPITVHGVFSAIGGQTKTVRMYVWRTLGTNGYYQNTHLSLIFIPSPDYGDVDLIDAPPSFGAPSDGGDAENVGPSVEPHAQNEDTVTVPRSLLEELLERVEELERNESSGE